MLQGFYLVPLVFLHSLCDTHLQPSDLPPRVVPINGTPLLGNIDGCTSTNGRLLLSHLQRFSKFSRNETPDGRLDALLPALRRIGFGVEPCFMLYLSALPRAFACSNLFHPPLHRRALRFACLKLLQAKDGVTTFLTVDPLDDLGTFSTPVVLQFRAGSYKTCILATHPLTLGSGLRPSYAFGVF